MKISSLIFLILSIMNTYAGDKGNGGDVLECVGLNGEKSYEILDYYEGYSESGVEVDIPDGNNFMDIVFRVFNERIKGNKSAISKEIEKGIKNVILNFRDNIVFVNHELPDIPDHGEVLIGENCRIRQAIIQYNDKNYNPTFKVNKLLWKNLSHKTKAGLVLHEAIYNQALLIGFDNSKEVRKENYYLARTDFSKPNRFMGLTYYTSAPSVRCIKMRHISEFDLYKKWAKAHCVETYLWNTVKNRLWSFNAKLASEMIKKALKEDISRSVKHFIVKITGNHIDDMIHKDKNIVKYLLNSTSKFREYIESLYLDTNDESLKLEIINILKLIPTKTNLDLMLEDIHLFNIYGYNFSKLPLTWLEKGLLSSELARKVYDFYRLDYTGIDKKDVFLKVLSLSIKKGVVSKKELTSFFKEIEKDAQNSVTESLSSYSESLFRVLLKNKSLSLEKFESILFKNIKIFNSLLTSSSNYYYLYYGYPEFDGTSKVNRDYMFKDFFNLKNFNIINQYLNESVVSPRKYVFIDFYIEKFNKGDKDVLHIIKDMYEMVADRGYHDDWYMKDDLKRMFEKLSKMNHSNEEISLFFLNEIITRYKHSHLENYSFAILDIIKKMKPTYSKAMFKLKRIADTNNNKRVREMALKVYYDLLN